MQQMAFGRAADGHRVEPCRLDEYVLRFSGDARIPSTHHTGEAEGLSLIGNDEAFAIKVALDLVQCFELFSLARPANNDRTLDLVEIEGVRRLTHREQDVVGRVDG